MKALLVSAAAIGLLSAAPAFATGAGPTTTANGTADAEIVAPISVNPATGGGNLNFGRIAADTVASTVTVDDADNRTSSTPNVLIAGGATPTAAHFDVGGAPGLAYTATTPATTTIDDAGTGAPMTVHLVQYSNGDASYVLDSVGADSFIVGGTLDVGANQTAGAYTGTFTVSVQYN